MNAPTTAKATGGTRSLKFVKIRFVEVTRLGELLARHKAV
jgi:hypothetical protein